MAAGSASRVQRGSGSASARHPPPAAAAHLAGLAGLSPRTGEAGPSCPLMLRRLGAEGGPRPKRLRATTESQNKKVAASPRSTLGAARCQRGIKTNNVALSRAQEGFVRQARDHQAVGRPAAAFRSLPGHSVTTAMQ